MGLVEILIFGIAIWLCIYALVERFCKSREICEMYKAYAAYLSSAKDESTSNIKADAFMKAFTNTGGDNKGNN